jgi:hypothetical protein
MDDIQLHLYLTELVICLDGVVGPTLQTSVGEVNENLKSSECMG